MKYKKRPYLLLEILIAFSLVVLCALPFLSAHLFVKVSQDELLQATEMDRYVSLFATEVYTDLLGHEHKWNALQQVKEVQPRFTVNSYSPLSLKGKISIRENKNSTENKKFYADLKIEVASKDTRKKTKTFTYSFFIEKRGNSTHGESS